MSRGHRICIALLGATTLFASPGLREELEAKLAQAPAADRSRLLAGLSAEIEPEDTERAWALARQARELARTPVDALGADVRMVSLMRRSGRYDEALTAARSAIARGQALGENRLRAEALLLAAWTEGNLSDFPASLELCRQLIPLAESLGDEQFLARAQITLGMTYFGSGQYELARQTDVEALRHAERGADRRVLASIYNNLGNIALRTDLVHARRYHEQALAIRLEGGNDARGVADSRQNLADIALADHRPADALTLLDAAIATHRKLGIKRNLANARLASATALLQLQRPGEARQQLESAQALVEPMGSPTMSERVDRAFASFHESQGDYRAALDWERRAVVAHDEALGEQARQRFDRLQAQFAAERRQHQIDALRREEAEKTAELQAVRWQQLGLLALLGLGVVLALAFAGRLRVRRKAEQRILAETRSAKESAEQAAALKSRLISIVSHDIRGPLSNVLSLVEDTSREPDPRTIAANLGLIAGETQRVTVLAQDLLDAAALEVGRFELRRERMDLAEVVRTTLGYLEPSARAKGQTLRFDCGARDAGLIRGDAARLGQVVANLVSNALKYSPYNTTVELALVRTERTVRLHVRDHGPGIPAEERPRLFQAFARLSTRPSGGETSVGLGLWLVHEFVRLHGGQVTVACPADGGSIFTAELPVLDRTDGEAPEDRPSPA